MPARTRNTKKSATERTRKDTIISVTVPFTTKTLIDMLSEFRGLSRSEYFRYLVLRDIEDYGTLNKILAEATAEGVKVAMGRPVEKKQTASALALEEEAAREALVEKFKIFEDASAWRDLFTENADGEYEFISQDYTCTREEFCDLPLDVMTQLINNKLNFVSNNEA